ncbi:MAG TPA: hypothetical protein VKY65_20245 [Alphaproteobacteria bacterium]|nr:hypothetical protein [Alphaproteobacteria bacterium]
MLALDECGDILDCGADETQQVPTDDLQAILLCVRPTSPAPRPVREPRADRRDCGACSMPLGGGMGSGSTTRLRAWRPMMRLRA